MHSTATDIFVSTEDVRNGTCGEHKFLWGTCQCLQASFVLYVADCNPLSVTLKLPEVRWARMLSGNSAKQIIVQSTSQTLNCGQEAVSLGTNDILRQLIVRSDCNVAVGRNTRGNHVSRMCVNDYLAWH